MAEYTYYNMEDFEDLEKFWELVGENVSANGHIISYGTKTAVIAYGTFLTGVATAVHITILIALARLVTGGGTGLNKHLLRLFSGCQLFAIIFVVPFEITREYLGRWPLGATFCKLWITYSHIFIPVKLWTLVALTLDKIYDLRSMGVYKYSKKNCKTALLVFAIFLFSFVGLVPHQVWLYTKQEFVLHEVCAVIVDKPYTVILSNLFYFIPSVTLIVCLLVLVSHVRRRIGQLHRAERQESLTALDPKSRCPVHEEQCRTSHDVDTFISDVKNSSVCLGVLSFICVSMWAPFYVANVWLSHGKCESTLCLDPKLWALFQWIGYTSCLVCPCVVFIDKRLRATVRYWLRLDINTGEFVYQNGRSKSNSTDVATSVL